MAPNAFRAQPNGPCTDFGPEIRIKPEKASVIAFTPGPDGRLSFQLVVGDQGRNGLEYLGLRFDGRRIYLRDGTPSGFYRKVTCALRHEVRAFVARYPGKDLDFLLANFRLEAFTSRFGRVEDFDLNSEYQDWTFWTYARRAASEFGLRGKPIYRQMRGHRDLIEKRMHEEFKAALASRGRTLRQRGRIYMPNAINPDHQGPNPG